MCDVALQARACEAYPAAHAVASARRPAPLPASARRAAEKAGLGTSEALWRRQTDADLQG